MNFAQRIDFATLMQPVALALLGEPNSMLSKPPRDVRYGTHGSLSVDFESGQFYDHEHNVGGGVLDLIGHKIGCDHSGAVSWLRTQGLLDESPAQANGKDRTGDPKKIVTAEHLYHDADGAVVSAVERIEYLDANGTKVLAKDGKAKKSYRQKRPDPDRPGHWLWNTDGVPALPYHLPELTEAIAADHLNAIVEGEKCADALWGIGIPATTNAMGAGKWKPEINKYFTDADIILLPDNDSAGYQHIQDVGAALSSIAKRLRVLLLPSLPVKGDACDWLAAGGTREQLDALIEKAPVWVPLGPMSREEEEKKKAAEAQEELLANLVKMPKGIGAARESKRLAKQFGVSRADIDAEIEARRVEAEAKALLHGHWYVEPWPEPVDGDALIRDIIRKLRKHVVMSHDHALAIALWIMFAWAHDAATHSPILDITSAEPDSGKSTTLGLISFLLHRCVSSVEISEAALYRAIELWQPSFAIDEFDSVLAGDDKTGLRSVINSGHTRGQTVVRCVGEDKTPQQFKTFAPKCIGMIGRKLPAATLSRCIMVELRRRKKDERIEKFRHVDDPELADLRSRLRRWSMDNEEALRAATVAMPEGFENRRGDNWCLQFAIADLAGEDWGDQARAAAVKIEAGSDSRTVNTRALADIRAIFYPKDDNGIRNRCCLAFSPDGKTLATGSWDWRIRLYDLATGKERPRLAGRHQGSILSLAFSPDGKRLASASQDTTVLVWDIAH